MHHQDRNFRSVGCSRRSERDRHCIWESLLRRRSRNELPNPKDSVDTQKWLRKLHVANAHIPPSEMAQSVKDAGGSAELVRAALKYECPLCNAERKQGQRRHSALPLRARYFNSVVVLDCATILLQRPDSEDSSIHVFGMIDSWSMLAQA